MKILINIHDDAYYHFNDHKAEEVGQDKDRRAKQSEKMACRQENATKTLNTTKAA